MTIHVIERRSFLLSGMALGSSFLLPPPLVLGQSNGSPVDPLPPADLTKIAPESFTDEELDLPFFVAHFHRVANSVRREEPAKGFIDIAVWRNKRDNMPYNARIMESILSLAFFYTVDRPWNPFLGDPRLRSRLEAALSFWCDSSKNGQFSEYGEGRYNLAATAFATKFMGESLTLLSVGKPKIDEKLFERVRQTQRKTIETVLTDKRLIEHGKSYSNQYTNVFAGGLAYLDQFPDEALRKRLTGMIRSLSPDLQSPVGFFYERNGADWSYNLGTHHSNLRMCLFYAQGTELEEFFLEEERRFIEWFAYNAVREPGPRGGYVLNHQIATRQILRSWQEHFAPTGGTSSLILLPSTPLAAAFLDTAEEVAAWRTRTRAALKRNWPRVEPLRVGEFTAFSPYNFLHRRHPAAHPTAAQKNEAIGQLPYIKTDRFTQQRVDSRVRTCFTFIRRPSYYLIFNSGERSPQSTRSYQSRLQYLGIGLLWTPQYGSLLQGQRDAEQAWGTRPDGASNVFESENFSPRFYVGQQEIQPQEGIRDLKGDRLRIVYDCGRDNSKTVDGQDHRIDVSIVFRGKFTEYLPLLAPSEHSIKRSNAGLVLTESTANIRIEWNDAVPCDLEKTNINVGGKQLFIAKIHAENRLNYSFLFEKRPS